MESLFADTPIVWTAFANGIDKPPQWHVHYFGHYTKLTSEHIQRLVATGAREFYSWSPTAEDPKRVEEHGDVVCSGACRHTNGAARKPNTADYCTRESAPATSKG
jgi:hypothetical protein